MGGVVMLFNNNCYICDGSTINYIVNENDTLKVNCPRCGKYKITNSARLDIELISTKNALVNVSYWIRKHQSSHSIPFIDSRILKDILVPFIAPKPIDQINNIILWVGDNQKELSEGIKVEYFNIVPIAGCHNEKDVEMIFNHLEKNGYIVQNDVIGLGMQELVVNLHIS